MDSGGPLHRDPNREQKTDRSDPLEQFDYVLPEEAKAELNDIVKNDPEHPFESATDALMAAAEKKLPIPMKDGKLLPIEQHFTIRFDPNTRKVELIQDDVQPTT